MLKPLLAASKTDQVITRPRFTQFYFFEIAVHRDCQSLRTTLLLLAQIGAFRGGGGRCGWCGWFQLLFARRESEPAVIQAVGMDPDSIVNLLQKRLMKCTPCPKEWKYSQKTWLHFSLKPTLLSTEFKF